MKLGIMQPYIFPYIGYFQLINSVDRFVVYDDVTFIKQGWINRNKILLNGEEHIFTVPLKNASSFTTIAQTEINQNLYAGWRTKFYKTLAQAYAKAPYYKEAMDVVMAVFDSKCDTISELAAKSLTETSKYAGVETEFVLTATGYDNNGLKAEERVIDICRQEKASVYINPIGGKELYSKENFKQVGLELYFLKSRNIAYKQFNATFVPWLSVIDVMMFNAPAEIKNFLKEYDLE
jgi:hypothetical protein